METLRTLSFHKAAALAVHVLAILLFLLVISISAPAHAHDWYPIECCSSIDCAPVEQYSFVAGAIFEHGSKSASLPRMVVTTIRGTFVLPDDMPRRLSKDSRMHVCSNGQGRVLCIFEPPGM